MTMFFECQELKLLQDNNERRKESSLEMRDT